MYTIDGSSKAFRKSVVRVSKRGYDMTRLELTISLLAEGGQLPANFQDHPLKGNYVGYRECHVDGANDWLLIYKKLEDMLVLVLTATGTHDDLFD